MSTRVCDDCGETCLGCDNQDDPHYCSSCSEKRAKQSLTLMVEVPMSLVKELDAFAGSLERAYEKRGASRPVDRATALLEAARLGVRTLHVASVFTSAVLNKKQASSDKPC